MGDKKKHLV